MRHGGYLLGLVLLASTPVAAEDAANAVADCLSQPSRACALASALRVTAEEELAISRVDSLIAIADSFARLGELERARTAVALAKQAAEDIGISIGTEQKLAEIVPVLATIGDIDEAIAMADGLADKLRTANALGAAALARARAGDAPGTARLLDRIDNPTVAMRFAVATAEALAGNGMRDSDLERLRSRLANYDNPVMRALGEARLAVIEADAGRLDEADRLARSVRDALDTVGMPDGRARIYAALAMIDLARGDRAAFEDDATRAVTLAKGVHSDLDRVAALSDVISSLSAGGRIEEAVALASGIDDLRDLGALLARLSEHRASAEAILPLAAHIESVVGASDSRFERDRGRLALARALAASGEIAPAIEVIGRIENDDQQAQALATLAPALD